MNRPVRRYVEKFEASDLSMGAYHARKLPRFRCSNKDFLTYLNAYSEEDLEMDWLDMMVGEDLEAR